MELIYFGKNTVSKPKKFTISVKQWDSEGNKAWENDITCDNEQDAYELFSFCQFLIENSKQEDYYLSYETIKDELYSGKYVQEPSLQKLRELVNDPEDFDHEAVVDMGIFEIIDTELDDEIIFCCIDKDISICLNEDDGSQVELFLKE